jgi:hypothetical protein
VGFFAAEYEAIRGTLYAPLARREPVYLGTIPEEARHLGASAAEGASLRHEGADRGS